MKGLMQGTGGEQGINLSDAAGTHIALGSIKELSLEIPASAKCAVASFAGGLYNAVYVIPDASKSTMRRVAGDVFRTHTYNAATRKLQFASSSSGSFTITCIYWE